MSVPSQAYVRDVQRIFADIMSNAEGSSIEFETVVTRVHEKVRPGKRKPSLAHRKRTLDAVNYEVNAHRLSVTDQHNPDLVTITPSGSAYYLDMGSSETKSEKRPGRVTKKEAVAEYLAAAAVLKPIKDAMAEYASMDPLTFCVETLPELILQTLELELRLQDENQTMVNDEQNIWSEFAQDGAFL